MCKKLVESPWFMRIWWCWSLHKWDLLVHTKSVIPKKSCPFFCILNIFRHFSIMLALKTLRFLTVLPRRFLASVLLLRIQLSYSTYQWMFPMRCICPFHSVPTHHSNNAPGVEPIHRSRTPQVVLVPEPHMGRSTTWLPTSYQEEGPQLHMAALRGCAVPCFLRADVLWVLRGSRYSEVWVVCCEELWIVIWCRFVEFVDVFVCFVHTMRVHLRSWLDDLLLTVVLYDL